jgi:hypothetical protein
MNYGQLYISLIGCGIVNEKPGRFRRSASEGLWIRGPAAGAARWMGEDLGYVASVSSSWSGGREPSAGAGDAA